METGKMYFTLGENAGFLIQEIAQEKMFTNFDISGAIKVIQDSMIGIDLPLALRLLSGELIAYMDVKDQSFDLKTIDESIEGSFPDHLNWSKRIDKFISKKNLQIGDDGRSYKRVLEILALRLVKDKKIAIDYEAIRELVVSRNLDEFLHEIQVSSEHMDQMILLLKYGVKYIEHSYAFLSFKDSIHKLYPHLVKYERGFPQVLDMFRYSLNRFMKGDVEEFVKQDEEMTQYFNAEKKFESLIAKEEGEKFMSMPVNPCKSAGWISPAGDYYGMNGSIANMLHCKLADLIIKEGLATKSPNGHGGFTETNSRLEELGWVKVHGRWVLFECNRYPKNKLTKSQISTLEKYAHNFDLSVLEMGFERKPCSHAKLGMLNGEMINKLFFTW